MYVRIHRIVQHQEEVCLTFSQTFKWGFSFLQIFIIVIALLIWTMGTCLLWLKSHFRLPFQDHLEVPRGYKPLLLLAQTIDHQFDAVGFDVHSLTNKQLKTEIRRSPGEESISL